MRSVEEGRGGPVWRGFIEGEELRNVRSSTAEVGEGLDEMRAERRVWAGGS